MHNILICSAGRRVSLVEIFKQEAKRLLAPESKVFTTDLEPSMAPACYASDKGFKVGRFADPNYIEDILKICIDNKVGLVIPTIDTELILLSKVKDRFLTHGVHLIVSDFDLIAQCRDKSLTAALFQNYNIKTPTQVDIKNPTYPFFAKPISGSSSVDLFVVRSQADIPEKILNSDTFVYQEYVDPSEYDEYTMDGYYDKGGSLQCLVPRLRIATRGGEVSKGITKKHDLYDRILKLLKHIQGAHGCLTIQVFLNRKTRKIFGIEINPRFGGGFPLSYKAGANYPGWLIKEYLLNEPIPFMDSWKENLLLLRSDNDFVVENFEHD